MKTIIVVLFLLCFLTPLFAQTDPIGAPVSNCTSAGQAMSYNATTHTFGCLTVGGSPITGSNEGTTGTTLNKLAKLTGAPATFIITGTGDTGNIIGPVISGAGTSGSATVAMMGIVSCVFDGATTAGHHVINSTTTNGDCEDSGSTTKPSSTQDMGFVLSTNGSAGTYQYLAISPP